MGTVKDWYLHYEKAGDQYVGQTVARISALSIEFAVSPAFFDFKDIPKLPITTEEMDAKLVLQEDQHLHIMLNMNFLLKITFEHLIWKKDG